MRAVTCLVPLLLLGSTAMADTLADALAEPYAYPYGKPRFPNLDVRAYFDPATRRAYAAEPWGSDVMSVAPWALMGLRAPTAMGSMRPFNPKAPEAPLPKRPTAEGDNGVGQHVYEALLGRSRKPGQDVAEPGSGWWMVAGQPIPKPTNVLPWAVSGGVGYGIWKGLGGDQVYDDLKYRYQRGVFPEDDPNNPRYDKARWDRIAKSDGEHAARQEWLRQHEIERKLGLVTNWSGPVSIFGPHPEPDDAKRAQAVHDYLTAGGIGNAPY